MLPTFSFTAGEAAAFLNEIMGLNLTAGQVAALERRTEGWIAGLQLAALSMVGRDDISGFVEAFSGSQHYILDYLTDEVLSQQPGEVQSFLKQTAILNRLTSSLCEAVTNRTDGQEMLEFLEAANLFVIPLGRGAALVPVSPSLCRLAATAASERAGGSTAAAAPTSQPMVRGKWDDG